MSSDRDDGFLTRWSRRKAAARREDDCAPLSPSALDGKGPREGDHAYGPRPSGFTPTPGPSPQGGGESLEAPRSPPSPLVGEGPRGGDHAYGPRPSRFTLTPGPSPQGGGESLEAPRSPPSPQGGGEELEHGGGKQEALTEADFADVDFAALDHTSDYSRFMQPGVPDSIRQKALARLWVSDPVLSAPDGLFDYAGDYTDKGVGAGIVETAYRVGRGFLSDSEVAAWEKLGRPEPPQVAAAERPSLGAAASPASAAAAEPPQPAILATGEREQIAAAAAAAAPAVAPGAVGIEPPAGVVIAVETPDQPEVRAFLDQSDALMASLYPAESNHLVDIATLAAGNVQFLVARRDGKAVGCGAIVLGAAGEAEVKRMFVAPEARASGVGSALLAALEQSARASGVRVLRLETGVRQAEALALYRRHGYVDRGPFGSYAADPLSAFMEKAVG